MDAWLKRANPGKAAAPAAVAPAASSSNAVSKATASTSNGDDQQATTSLSNKFVADADFPKIKVKSTAAPLGEPSQAIPSKSSSSQLIRSRSSFHYQKIHHGSLG